MFIFHLHYLPHQKVFTSWQLKYTSTCCTERTVTTLLFPTQVFDGKALLVCHILL